MPDKKTKNSLIKELSAVMEALSSVTGQHMEVVLHDLEHPEASVLRIVNGHVSGRQVGSSLLEGPENDMGFTGLLGQEVPLEKTEPAVYTNYRTVGPQGRPLRSSTVLFRDESGKATLSLCFNADYSEVDVAREALSRLMPIQPVAAESGEAGLESRMHEIICACIPPSGQLKVGATKKEKVEIVRQMQEKGLFIVRGGVEMAARVLGVTRYTVYNYLDEIKKTQLP
ncbi:helix-turn-helix transcriptional regulator [Pantoea agglomerans]|uniref:PAS domain-containing protein n=1 Tax=Enterobacter agglomerans TaxID=549 RepID=A0AAN2FCN1_ENTAG|nr:PAS domain-containing protein [Pantoea agglomerans]CAH6289484.1 PAS domain-containing protein [Pantoea agglomerans]